LVAIDGFNYVFFPKRCFELRENFLAAVVIFLREVLTPWPAVGAEQLQPYTGRYESDNGFGVLINIQEGRLIAFPDESPGVFLMPTGGQTFTPMMTEQARVTFEGAGVTFAAGAGLMAALLFEQDGQTMRLVRVP
jgi:hypothetical protein